MLWSQIQIKKGAYRITKINNKCQKNWDTLLDLSVSSLRRGHANLLCIVPILADDPEGFQHTIDIHPFKGPTLTALSYYGS
jgi:hypothetical protein